MEFIVVGEYSDFCKEWFEIIVLFCFLSIEELGDFFGVFYEEGVCRAIVRGFGFLGIVFVL